MRLNRLTRIALHLLLAAFLVVPGIAASAQAVAGAVQAAASAATADMAEAGRPCDLMGHSSAEQPPCDCCVPQACDFSACLGTGCLPELPRLVAAIPPVAVAAPWRQSPVPTGVTETPFRPPIA